LHDLVATAIKNVTENNLFLLKYNLLGSTSMFRYIKTFILIETKNHRSGLKKQEGITLTHEQEWKQGLKSFYFDDPFGNVLEIVPVGIWE
jgi:hypothetical protein